MEALKEEHVTALRVEADIAALRERVKPHRNTRKKASLEVVRNACLTIWDAGFTSYNVIALCLGLRYHVSGCGSPRHNLRRCDVAQLTFPEVAA